MSIGETVYSTLSSASGVTAIVGTAIYPLVIPQGAGLPAVTYQRIAGARSNDLAGAGELTHVRIQVDCWATTYSSVRALADAVGAAMHAALFLPLNDIDDFDDEVPVYRVVLEFTTWT